MVIEWGTFLSELMSNPMLVAVTLLNIGVIIVNGATDAPNAIATVVSTRCMKAGPAIAMAAICNFLGLLVITLVSSAVANTIFHMVDFGGDHHQALIALLAAMVAIIVWGVAAWAFGIPTSQSHSLIAGLTGAAIALQGGFGGINGAEWAKVVYGILLSTHNPEHALNYANRILVLKNGKVLSEGSPQTAVDRQILNEAYGVNVRIHSIEQSDGSYLVCVPDQIQ